MQYRILRVLLVAMVMTIDKQVGGCTAIRQTHKMIEDCKNGDSGVIFYSFNESEHLVDILYKPDDTYHAIQVTIGQTHDCDEDKLKNFLDTVGLTEEQELSLVYAVPNGKFGRFTTSPVKPRINLEVAGVCYIVHPEIPQP